MSQAVKTSRIARWRRCQMKTALAGLVALMLTEAGCGQSQAVVKSEIDVAAEACKGILDLTEPGLAPLCFTADEIAQAILALVEKPKLGEKVAAGPPPTGGDRGRSPRPPGPVKVASKCSRRPARG